MSATADRPARPHVRLAAAACLVLISIGFADLSLASSHDAGTQAEAASQASCDARHSDAHQLVKELEGPFDFIFTDADKEWYTQYFKDLDPKLVKGGCFTAHNASNAYSGIKEFLDYIRSRPGYQTSIDRSSSSGISISYKK